MPQKIEMKDEDDHGKAAAEGEDPTMSSFEKTTTNERGGSIQTEETNPLRLWEQWVPMDRQLYKAVQIVHLCMLQRIDEMFANHAIPYWICGGTLMGAIRHQGLIPHDDDVDIECFERDLEKIAAIPLDPPLYTGFVPNSGQWEGHAVGKLQFFRGEFEVDVFPRASELPSLRHFPSHEEVFPLKRYAFHNIELWGPGEPGAYLDRCYGENWRESVAVWNHDYNWYHGTWFNPCKMVLSLGEYEDVVSKAGVVAPIAKDSATETFQVFCKVFGEEFFEQYKKYRFQRVFRRNRAAAEWCESQR